jgi:hypothetical protein
MGFNPFCQHLLWSFAFLVSWGSLCFSTPTELDSGDYWSRATARVMFFWWSVAMIRFLLPGLNREEARLVWTFSFIAYAIHFVTAFAKYHHWSHSSAYEHVEESSGFGPGIFVSYAFTLLWLLDVLWSWVYPASYWNRSRWLNRSLVAFMAFIVFNGTVVYESGGIRWVGVVVFVLLTILLLRRLHSETRMPESLPSD